MYFNSLDWDDSVFQRPSKKGTMINHFLDGDAETSTLYNNFPKAQAFMIPNVDNSDNGPSQPIFAA